MAIPNFVDHWTSNRRTTFTIKQISETHRRVEAATNRGRVYAQTWAAEPSDPLIQREQVEELWLTDRKSWRPFDQTQGVYCK